MTIRLKPDDTKVDLSEDLHNWVAVYRQAKAKRDEMDAIMADARERITQFIVDADATVALDNGAPVASYREIETTRLDSKRIGLERPDIYAEFSKTGTARRFDVA